MLEIARTTSLEVLREAPMGLMLGRSERNGDEVLLPNASVPVSTKVGDVIEVFLYLDSEDRPIATTAKPLAQAGEFAGLRVVSVNPTGAFLDWGLPKDLLLPFRLQLEPVRLAQKVAVWVDCDALSGRPIANAKVERFLEPPPEDLREGQAVDLLIYAETDLGFKAIVDSHFGGLLYPEPGQAPPQIGATVTGYVRRIRPDGKVDLTITPSGKSGADQATAALLQALEAAGGRLDLSDRSTPQEIRSRLGLSKKAFKRAVGALYRQRRIRLEDASIELTTRARIGTES